MALKPTKYSYSKLNTYASCPWKYNLCYNEGHYIFTESIATLWGTLVHFIEENIGNALAAGEPVDYEKLKQDFVNINIPKTSKFDTKGGIFGTQILKQQYPEQYFATDEFGQSYATKTKYYLDHGIYRLEKWMKEHPDYVVYDTEKAFSITWQGEIFSGFIDRILYNQNTNSYIIEDIKTKDKPFKPDELATPLQFVIYVLALENVLDDPSAQISCYYDLPFCDQKQAAGTKGFMERGKNKLQQICYKIREKDFTPSPSPLCAWCNFSPTNPAQPEEGKGLCPYYSLWTSSNRVFTVANEWEGIENHPIVLAREAKKAELNKELNIDFDF